VVVAVTLVDVMAVPVDHIVDVAIMLHRWVAAARAVDVVGVVAFAVVGAGGGGHGVLYVRV
jgi:hypothetical protein